MSDIQSSSYKIGDPPQSPVVHPVLFAKGKARRLVESVRTQRTSYKLRKELADDEIKAGVHSDYAVKEFYRKHSHCFYTHAERTRAKSHNEADYTEWVNVYFRRFAQLSADLFTKQLCENYTIRFSLTGDKALADAMAKTVRRIENNTRYMIKSFRAEGYPIDAYIAQHFGKPLSD